MGPLRISISWLVSFLIHMIAVYVYAQIINSLHDWFLHEELKKLNNHNMHFVTTEIAYLIYQTNLSYYLKQRLKQKLTQYISHYFLCMKHRNFFYFSTGFHIACTKQYLVPQQEAVNDMPCLWSLTYMFGALECTAWEHRSNYELFHTHNL